jgi:hypothetical protein
MQTSPPRVAELDCCGSEACERGDEEDEEGGKGKNRRMRKIDERIE